MSRKRTALPLLALAASLTLAACGSTVATSRQVAVGGGELSAGDPSGLGGPTTQAPATQDPGGAVLPGRTDAGTPQAGPTSASVSSQGPTTSSQPAPAKTAAGSSPVEVGMAYSANAGVFLAALGVKGDVPDGRQFATPVLNYINAHGGLGGHRIKPVYYNVDLTRTDPYSAWMAEMCAMWTQDHKVVAALVGANSDFLPVARCLAKKGASFYNPAAWVRTQGDYNTNPYLIEPGMITAERLTRAYIDVPEKLGYFGTKPKIGLIVYDYAQSKKLGNDLASSLKKRGYDVATSVTVHMGTSTPDLAGTIAAVQSAVLRFRAAGVDHVMSAAYPGAVTFFMEYAQSQSYFPRYALNSNEGLIAVAANAPARQLKDAVALGWMPDADVAGPQRPAFNTTALLCKGLFVKSGISAAIAPAGFPYCDFLLSLKAAADKGAGLVGAPYLRSVNSLGSSYLSPSGFGTLLNAGQHGGVVAGRPLRFDSGCACWKYVGPVQTLP